MRAETSRFFLGLSGTGKTTLSTDPERALIGDDEHAWSDTGVANFENGCYAKLYKLDPQKEPEVYNAVFHPRPLSLSRRVGGKSDGVSYGAIRL